MARRIVGSVYAQLGSHPRSPGDSADIDAEYEPEETIEILESALCALGHEPVRIGSPEALLASLGDVLDTP